jgi:hypothetical protein
LRGLGIGQLLPRSFSGGPASLAVADPDTFMIAGTASTATARRAVITAEYANAPDPFGYSATNTFDTMDLLALIDFVNYVPANGAVYPTSTFGQGLRSTAALIKAQLGVEVIEVDVTGCEGFGEIQERLLAAVDGIAASDMVKAVLTGALSPEVSYDAVHLAGLLGERFYFARVKDHTTLAINPEDYAHDVSLKGEFIRTVMASRLPEQEKQRTILCGLRALRGEEVDV